MERPQISGSEQENEPNDHDRLMSRSRIILDRFREIDGFMTEPPRDATEAQQSEAADLHDHFMGILDELPNRDLPLASKVYETLTDSDNPRDRYWAATFYPSMIVANRAQGLSMLRRLIGFRESDWAVRDQAYETLTTDVASADLLTFQEGIEYIGWYVVGCKHRRSEEDNAPGSIRIHPSNVPRSFPPPGDPTIEPSV